MKKLQIIVKENEDTGTTKVELKVSKTKEQATKAEEIGFANVYNAVVLALKGLSDEN